MDVVLEIAPPLSVAFLGIGTIGKGGGRGRGRGRGRRRGVLVVSARLRQRDVVVCRGRGADSVIIRHCVSVRVEKRWRIHG